MFKTRRFRMKAYVVKEGKWQSHVRCICLTEEIAKNECLKLARKYGIENNYEDFIFYDEYEVIDKPFIID